MSNMKLILLAMAASLIAAAGGLPASAETINWNNPAGELTQLPTGVYGVAPSSPSNNQVNINADIGGEVFGGYLYLPSGTSFSGNNTVTVGAVTAYFGVNGSKIFDSTGTASTSGNTSARLLAAPSTRSTRAPSRRPTATR